MTQDDVARRLIGRYWDGLLEAEPILGTAVGDERFDDRLPDPGPEGRAARERLHAGALDEVGLLDREELGDDLRISIDILEAIARRDLASLEHRTDRLWAASHLWGPAGLIGDLASLQRVDTPERVERFAARISATPKFYDASADLLREGIADGVTAPRIVVERAIGQTERILEAGAEDSPLLAQVAADDATAREAIVEPIERDLLPALGRYLDGLRSYLPSATETIGLSALPNGEPMYASQILSWTTLPLDPRATHELGLEDLAKIQDERTRSAQLLGSPDPASATAALAASGENAFASKEELKAFAEEQVRRSWEAAPAWFGRIPSANCEVRLVEEFRERDMPFAFYNQPTEDGSRPGVYYVNGFGLSGKPRHHLASTTYHEANPGHHFQIALEQQMEGNTTLRRFGGLLAGSAFTEGWGLYSERLADEMGLYLDEAERLGMLDLQGMRAARLVVDTGIHALGWTRDRAIRTMEEAGVPNVDAVIETDRYITMPGQALSYKVGQFEIERQRAAAAERDGASFSLSAFHDRLLSLGSLPLAALRRELGRSA
ncbi:MAG: DUF885 domain-containing protein [Actinobacteria bacterium]|nr:DUF885 domain-containing protein [Actinomycetota bacterium]